MENATQDWPTTEPTLPTFYAVIPAEVRYHKRLSASAKLMFGEITALTNTGGFCYATNAYFERVFDCGERSVQGWLDQLVKAGFLRLEFDPTNTKRRIYLTQVFARPPAKKFRKPPAEKCDQITQGQNTPNEQPPADADSQSPHKTLIDLWAQSYEMQFGRAYVFEGGKDAKAVKDLLQRTKLEPAALISIATRAWAKRTGECFNCKRAVTLTIFASAYNQILNELDPPGEFKQPAKITPPAGLKPYSTQPTPGYDEQCRPISHEEWERRFPLKDYYDDLTGRPMA